MATVAVTYFGRDPRYLLLLDAWVAQFRRSGCRWPFIVVSDMATPALAYPMARFDISAYEDMIRPDQPFDVKGALMAEAALALGPMLMLDADALLMQDPEPHLSPFATAPIAMPLDHGAIPDGRTHHLNPPYNDVKKTCAGVAWFGSGDKTRLVRMWREAFAELLPVLPWPGRIPCLVEQFAWSLASHRCGGSHLPWSFNYPRHCAKHHAGAIVNHYFGGRKLVSPPAFDPPPRSSVP